jgi:L-amino acid N-acyltransferase YncA
MLLLRLFPAQSMRRSRSLSVKATGGGGGVSVRPAEHADAIAIAGIFNHWVRTSTAPWVAEDAAPCADEMRRRLLEGQATKHPWLVACGGQSGNEILGFCYVAPFRAPRHGAGWSGCVENSVYVSPASHRKGVGGALLHALIQACGRRAGFTHLVAVVSVSRSASAPNPALGAASVALHAGLGFREVGLLPGVGAKAGQRLDALLMLLGA